MPHHPRPARPGFAGRRPKAARPTRSSLGSGPTAPSAKDRHLVFVAALAVAACAPSRDAFTLVGPPEWTQALEAFAAPVEFPIAVRASQAPAREGGPGVVVALVDDLDCEQCYRLEAVADGRFVVHAGDLLGAQYGLAELFEAHGFAFLHPFRTRVPGALARPSPERFGVERQPTLTVRGLQLHTLHPIEGYYALWEPSDASLASARRIVDWLVKNRGNFLTWPGLDDIQKDPATYARWAAHTRAVLDEAHLRGVRVGLGVQLFGQSNLQRAFDLLDDKDDPPEPAAAIRQRLSLPVSLPFDSLQLSFGEFFGADPKRFIARSNDVYAQAQALSPGIEVSAAVHVGTDNTVQHDGQTMLYYFLVRYVDPRIIPWVHTVMFYNLYEDAGRAYHHDDFFAHRELLQSYLTAGRRAVYFPESAYWVAFDNSIPVYLPLYVRSRWLDLKKLTQGPAPLREHVLFSTGWEWGYWQNDAATLRMGFSVPEHYQDALGELWASFGESADALAAATFALAEAQHQGLLVGRLAPYYAGRDVVIDAGRARGIVSQPDRPTFAEVAQGDAAFRADFARAVLSPLLELAVQTEAAFASLPRGGTAQADPFVAELFDGMEVDGLRARFAHAVWSAAALHGDGKDVATLLVDAQRFLDQARVVVNRRHRGLHHPEPSLLLRAAPNATLYPFGYLYEARSLCYWERELAQLEELLSPKGASIPACIELDLR